MKEERVRATDLQDGFYRDKDGDWLVIQEGVIFSLEPNGVWIISSMDSRFGPFERQEPRNNRAIT